ncbi:MAG TPA: K(+)-transporting ATPase subunit C [Prosthecobacter sp.]
MKNLLQEIRPALVSTIILASITCAAYPLAVTGIGQTLFPNQASGSLLHDRDGKVIGSSLIGQNFTADRYFHPRPSVAGSGYDASSSGGSNLGPTSQKLHDQIQERIAAYRKTNGVPDDVPVPADAVTASASGLDPHISPANARLQADRVARARNFPVNQVTDLLASLVEPPDLGFLGEARINVLRLNLALDSLPSSAPQ